MPEFRELYEYCQKLEPKIKRNAVIETAERITGKKITVIMASLDTSQVRGFFISASNKDSPYVKQIGTNVIVLARGMPDLHHLLLKKAL